MNKKCPCGQPAIGMLRGVAICETCTRRESAFGILTAASSFMVSTPEEIAARLLRYTEDQWAKECAKRYIPPPRPASLTDDGETITICGYGEYTLSIL